MTTGDLNDNRAKSDIKISVVVPAYNSEETIRRAILSILNQSEQPEEVIVVNDGSTDHTLLILEEFLDEIIVISQKNQGSSVARQSGSIKATGEYIAYLDADDFWPPNKLALMTEVIQKCAPDFLIGDLNRLKETPMELVWLERNSSFYPQALKYIQTFPTSIDLDSVYELPQKEALNVLLDGFPVYPSTMIVKKASLMAAGGWDKRFARSQDFDLGLRLARNFKMLYMHEILATIGIHDAHEDVNSYVSLQTKGDILVLQTHLQNESNKNHVKLLQSALAKKYILIGRAQAALGNKVAACKYFLSASKLPSKRVRATIDLIKTLLS